MGVGELDQARPVAGFHMLGSQESLDLGSPGRAGAARAHPQGSGLRTGR